MGKDLSYLENTGRFVLIHLKSARLAHCSVFLASGLLWQFFVHISPRIIAIPAGHKMSKAQNDLLCGQRDLIRCTTNWLRRFIRPASLIQLVVSLQSSRIEIEQDNSLSRTTSARGQILVAEALPWCRLGHRSSHGAVREMVRSLEVDVHNWMHAFQ